MKKITSVIQNKVKYNSYFDKNLKDYFILKVKVILIIVCTLGIGAPWAIALEKTAECHHTVICGKRLKFIGNPRELMWHWLLWGFLSIITLGLYAIVAKIRMEQWEIANTVFEDTTINDEDLSDVLNQKMKNDFNDFKQSHKKIHN